MLMVMNILQFKNLSSYANCTHFVTQKNASEGYAFSLALHTNENPVSILRNRESLQEQFPKMQFIVANQTHSDHIKVVTHAHEKGWRDNSTAIKDCDALISNQPNIMLTILTADCVPLLLFDPKKNIISAIHAGWNGTKKNIAFKTVNKMNEQFGVDPKDIIVGVAPSIGRCCYEVGEDVAQHFFEDALSFTKIGKKYMLDLPHINQQQLLRAGVLKENIELSHVCTACEVEHYFSYRKEQGCSGRFMSMIGLNSELDD